MTWGNNVLLRPADDGDVASEYICTTGEGMREVSTISINWGAATRQDLASQSSLHPHFAYDTI